MAIEFHCIQCGRLLRVGDEALGQQARCPECGAVMPVFVGKTEQPGQPPQEGPTVVPPQYAAEGEAAPPLIRRQLEIGEVFDRTWAVFRLYWAEVLGAIVLVWLVNVVCSGVIALATGIAGRIAPDFRPLFAWSQGVILVMLGTWLHAGQLRYLLRRAGGKETSVADVFSGGPYFLQLLLAGIVVGIVVGLGFMLLIIPGIILAMMFSQVPILIVDRNLGAFEAFDVSRQLMIGNKGTYFLIIVICVVAGSLLTMLTCMVGLIAVVPFLSLLYPVAYLLITGQRVVG